MFSCIVLKMVRNIIHNQGHGLVILHFYVLHIVCFDFVWMTQVFSINSWKNEICILLVFVLLKIMCKCISNVSISVASFTSVPKVPEHYTFFFKIFAIQKWQKMHFSFQIFAHWYQNNTLWNEASVYHVLKRQEERYQQPQGGTNKF